MRINLRREIDESYDIVFGEHLFIRIAKELPADFRYAIITDSTVARLYGDAFHEILKQKGFKVALFSFAAGEISKNFETCMQIIKEMSQQTYGRDSFILALGGGVVGDVAGFVAALFNRGVPYIQIPTTLVAQADAALGGKTGVDTAFGKNLIGVIKQPQKVYIDIALLKTLPDRVYRNGLAETIKHGVIQDQEFFNYLQQNADKILQRDPDVCLHIARQNCRIKGKVVEQDPHEKGLRRVLNYGHTIGHALEKLSDYNLSHGEAVAMGMMVAGRIAVALGYFSAQELEQQKQLLQKFGMPVVIPATYSDEAIMEATSHDKKTKAGHIRYALPAAIGRMCEFDGAYATRVDDTIVKKALLETRSLNIM